ncbi:hypothetical protein Psed_0852 [Pseudonocardia dioxanivorans CB1190]|uniref:Uncharacterized protein n=1 Tax=Pseudonocardia dioxanivorans (strain ATCC 55486 / DSM 44775 / JCM 13855 / CB1190) TaxID=675635 RepID=F4CSD2_PSEUX|nr:hypothetical protein [Pseudonocardia dioxanivorans]AEA23106.1 hypothetical protein Psed_0852 [Pseudonocardia dioxanivorans CB1190]GJF04526.1 hypothetical protein PSD17_34810 [Pseudonocardia sp. D17]
MASQTGGIAARTRSLPAWRVAGAILLLLMGGIHLYLVLFGGFDGLVGTLFVINAIGALILAIAMVGARDRQLPLVSLLSLLFTAGTLLSLVLALLLPGGFLGVREQLGGELVVTTLIVEGLGVLALLGATFAAARLPKS